MGPGSVQRYERDARPLSRFDSWFNGWQLTEKFRYGLERTAALNTLSLSSDCHSGNILANPETGEVFLIDNGLSNGDPNSSLQEVLPTILQEMNRPDLKGVPFEDMSERDQNEIQKKYVRLYNDDLVSIPLEFLKGQPIDEGIVQDYERLKKVLENESSEVRSTLMELYKHFFGETRGEKRFEQMRERLNILTDLKRYPPPSLFFQHAYLPSLKARVEKQRKNLTNQ
jgi:hypothetical protein